MPGPLTAFARTVGPAYDEKEQKRLEMALQAYMASMRQPQTVINNKRDPAFLSDRPEGAGGLRQAMFPNADKEAPVKASGEMIPKAEKPTWSPETDIPLQRDAYRDKTDAFANSLKTYRAEHRALSDKALTEGNPDALTALDGIRKKIDDAETGYGNEAPPTSQVTTDPVTGAIKIVSSPPQADYDPTDEFSAVRNSLATNIGIDKAKPDNDRNKKSIVLIDTDEGPKTASQFKMEHVDPAWKELQAIESIVEKYHEANWTQNWFGSDSTSNTNVLPIGQKDEINLDEYVKQTYGSYAEMLREELVLKNRYRALQGQYTDALKSSEDEEIDPELLEMLK